MPREHDVFISFAEPDRKLANILHELFNAVGISSYFAPEALRKTPHDWEDGILRKGLRQSDCFVPIFSKHSLNRKWVIFEAGAATALGRKIFAARVEGITPEEIREFPRAYRLQSFTLCEPGDIKALIENIGGNKYKNQNERYLAFLSKVDEIFFDKSTNERGKLIKQLVCEAKKHWIFIAGNLPEKPPAEQAIAPEDFRSFVKSLSVYLFEAGFNLSACPQVPDVGGVVLATSEAFIAKDGFCDAGGCEVDYEIAGIYPVDQQLRSSPISNKELENQWKQHLLRFRRSYLENKDWLIVIGGNAGTTDEFEVVKEINKTRPHGIKVCLIPYFGGVGKDLLSDRIVIRNPSLYFNGCEGWNIAAGLEKLAEKVAKLIKEN